jgi:3-dehydroquinate dehydratase
MHFARSQLATGNRPNLNMLGSRATQLNGDSGQQDNITVSKHKNRLKAQITGVRGTGHQQVERNW